MNDFIASGALECYNRQGENGLELRIPDRRQYDIDMTSVRQELKSLSDTSEIASFYDGYYEDGSQVEWRKIGARGKADHIEMMCRNFSPQSVLEVGVGEGAVLAELSRRQFGVKLYGVEISDSGLRAATTRNIPNVESLQRFDGYNLPFPDKSIDLVYATHVLEHVEHERLFLKELRRVGRLVFLEVPLEDTLRVKGAIHNSIGHINFYNRHTFISLLKGSGFEVIQFKSFNFSYVEQTFSGVTATALGKITIRAISHRLSESLAEKMFVFCGAAIVR